MKQKADYIHLNHCRAGLVKLPEEYVHSSAKYYYTGEQGIYPVMTYMELQDIDLTSRGMITLHSCLMRDPPGSAIVRPVREHATFSATACDSGWIPCGEEKNKENYFSLTRGF